MWDASLVSLPMFTDGIATKWASHIHRGLTVYSEQSLFRHSFYHSINISCTFPLFLTAWIYISHTSSIDTYISITLQRKKSSCDFCGKNKVIVALLYSIKPTVTTNFKYVPRSSKASFSCCCWKQSFCSSCSSSIWLHVKLFITILRDMRIRYKEITLNDLVPKGSHPQNLNRHTCDLS